MINLTNYIKNDLLCVRVVPNSSRIQLVEENSSLKLYLRSPPDKNKANLELIKFFKKEYHLRVQIKSGARSREKVLEMRR